VKEKHHIGLATTATIIPVDDSPWNVGFGEGHECPREKECVPTSKTASSLLHQLSLEVVVTTKGFLTPRERNCDSWASYRGFRNSVILRNQDFVKTHLVPQLSRDADLVQGQTDDPKKTPSQYEILVTRLK